MNRPGTRDELLAFVAEKYYQEDQKQADIADGIGVTRSAVSRMLTEARQKGLVEIIIHHPLQFDHELEDIFQQEFCLEHVSILEYQGETDYARLRQKLGKAAARVFSGMIRPGFKVGIGWGTSVQATIEAFEHIQVSGTEVVQLVGVLGSSRHSYSAQTLVDQMAQKLGGAGTYLYAPFIVENGQTAASLVDDHVVEQALIRGRECDVALMGIGTTKPAFCSLLRGNYLSEADLQAIRETDAVGDVCALYFTQQGNLASAKFHDRRIGISWVDLKAIPTRVAVAGWIEKAEAVLGAIRGGIVNTLVTDSLTARRVLELQQAKTTSSK